MFEPFHPRRVRLWKRHRLRPYLRPEDKDSEMAGPIGKILSGQVRERRIDHFNKNSSNQKRLIKCVFANLLLKWIHANFRDIKIILLLRHPCAVSHSRLRSRLFKGYWRDLKDFLSQAELKEDFLEPFLSQLENANDPFEKEIFKWCIEYYVPLRQFKNTEIHLAFYENFCVRPEYEIDRLFSFLGKTRDRRVFGKLKDPSPTAKRQSAVITGENPVDSWKRYISEEKIKRAVDILKIFSLDKIYSKDPMPKM